MSRGSKPFLLAFVLVLGTPILSMTEEAQDYGQIGAFSSSDCFVYAAGPYGFTESTKRFMEERYYKAITDAGCKVLDPWRHNAQNYDRKMVLGKLNAVDIMKSNGIVAALDGSDVDSGTAAEIGYAAALKKWVIGYREDLRQTGEGGDVQINSQVQFFIEGKAMGRGKIVNNLDDLTKEICIITGGQFVKLISRNHHGSPRCQREN